MVEIIKDNHEEFIASNEFLNFKFIKNGINQGKYYIEFKENGIILSQLKDCYSAINFLSQDSKLKSEFKLIQNSFISQINHLKDKLGNGIEVIFIPISDEKVKINFKLRVKIYDNNDFILIRIIDIDNKTKEKAKVHSISPFTIKNSNLWLSGINSPSNLREITWFKNGFQSFSPCELLFGDQKDTKGLPIEILNLVYDNQDYVIEGRFYSEYCTVITDLNSNNSFIIGFTTLWDQFSRIILDYDDYENVKCLTAIGCMDGLYLNENSINSSEELFISFKKTNLGYYGLIDYAKVINSVINKKRIVQVPVGWCSWYYYYTGITQEDMVKNLEFFRNKRDELPIDFIQLDDGYFTAIGDYDIINQKFSNGLEWLFTKINESNFVGGIWTAPFFAIRKSQLFKKHRDWILTRNNKLLKLTFNWNAFEYGLDLTNQEVIKYLSDFFSRLKYAFNEDLNVKEKNRINFFKIDFLYAGVPFQADYSNKNLTRAQLYYNAVKTIREAISDDSFLLGCGAPLGPCVGLVDGMRISYDTGPDWDGEHLLKLEGQRGIQLPALKVALINILYRSFMHKYLWINDPDCLMIRRTDTKLNLNEIKLQLTLFGLSGGQILISDDMTKLSESEISDAKLIIPPYNPENFDPILVDGFSSKLPTIYMLETNEVIGKRYLVAIINWEDNSTDEEMSISELIPNIPNDEKSYYVFDFWNQMLIGKFKKDDKIQLKELKPHSCFYLSIILTNENLYAFPQVISSSLHISQGCHEIKKIDFLDKENQINIEFEIIGQRNGVFYLKLPKNKKISHYQFDFSNFDENENIWKLNIQFQNKISLTVNLI